MQSNNSSLGKGLSALLGTNSVVPSGAMEKIVDIDRLEPNIHQPRQYFDDKGMDELVDSIKSKGVLQPILVRKKDDKFEIIAGERRWRAAKKAHLPQVPIVMINCTDEEALEIGLVENIQRQDLNPMEEAESLKKLHDFYQQTQDYLASRISKSRSYVANMLRINNLPENVKDKIREGLISAGHAKILVAADNQEDLANKIIRENLNVRETENLLKNTKKQNLNQSLSKEFNVDIKIIEEKISKILNAKVDLKINKNGGNISINFQSYEELDDILNKIEKIIF